MNSNTDFYKVYFIITIEEMFHERISIVFHSCGGYRKEKRAKP
jgi:hypothetical protein